MPSFTVYYTNKLYRYNNISTIPDPDDTLDAQTGTKIPVYSDKEETHIIGYMINDGSTTCETLNNKNIFINHCNLHYNKDDSLYSFVTHVILPFDPLVATKTYFPNFKYKAKCDKNDGHKSSELKVKFKMNSSGQKKITIYK